MLSRPGTYEQRLQRLPELGHGVMLDYPGSNANHIAEVWIETSATTSLPPSGRWKTPLYFVIAGHEAVGKPIGGREPAEPPG